MHKEIAHEAEKTAMAAAEHEDKAVVAPVTGADAAAETPDIVAEKSDEAQQVALRHEALRHQDAQRHHHHSHADDSQHAGGHHLLQVEDLSISFEMYDEEASSMLHAQKITQKSLRNLSLSVHAGEVVAVVGASGSGKTLLADAIMGLFAPNAQVTGTIWFNGERQDAASLTELRGVDIALVPQSVNYLDPLMKVGKQVRGLPARGEKGSKQRRKTRQKELFRHFDLGEEVEKLYPFELSGGMARRVLLSCALMEDPKLLVADEPTPGLDLELAVRALADFREFADQGGGVLLITHDIELALHVADRVAVFQDGTVVEETAVANFASPDLLEHPFSKMLWHALPEHGFDVFDRDSADVEAGGRGEDAGVDSQDGAGDDGASPSDSETQGGGA